MKGPRFSRKRFLDYTSDLGMRNTVYPSLRSKTQAVGKTEDLAICNAQQTRLHISCYVV